MKILAAVICLSVILMGCGAQKAESSKEAIETAKTMETVQQKTDYLVTQAKTFYSSKEFQGAIDIAQYVLRYLDKDSQAAKGLLERAKAELTAQAKGAVGDAKKKFGL